ncbi:N(6)-adenine-specific methyltransferase METTL4 [Culex quinquefasciatus]|uniref:N(6)-adenine-specific methyltransferase METTL4 n=1 Tax=Culex quinquefasciatus TaxID=7176 RepID=UPI0018E3D42B|nr:N(6)-adenine-specific methyltransferase METTL4 [Culex quinquefasciatus]
MGYQLLSDTVVLLDHKAAVDKIYSNYKFYDDSVVSASLKSQLFHIVSPYDRKTTVSDDVGQDVNRQRSKRKKVAEVFDETTEKVRSNHTEFLKLSNLPAPTEECDNRTALEFVDGFNRDDRYDRSKTYNGANSTQFVVLAEFASQSYLIPPNCRFFNSEVSNLANLLAPDDRFDFVVLDPPWWNKYIRRTKAVNSKISYQMLDNNSIGNIPLGDYVHENTIVAIWCTNSPTHVAAIRENFCTKWKLKLVANWYWVKVTKFGEPVCAFNGSNKKQPYEQIFIAVGENNTTFEIPKERFIYSVPSAFHSNKPPLVDLFESLLPERPKCLEIFARNVYPNFTSVGTEVLKLQNANLFDVVKRV